jgi:hypothetical protein
MRKGSFRGVASVLDCFSGPGLTTRKKNSLVHSNTMIAFLSFVCLGRDDKRRVVVT